MSTTLTAAYAAGLIDGEGCISIGKSGHVYAPTVNVGMTKVALPLLEQLHRQWGGSLEMNRPATEKWAEAWRWMLHGTACEPFLREIGPHLRVKREQCDLALALIELRVSLIPEGNVSARWTDEAIGQATLMKERMRELNRKGPEVPIPEGWFARLVGGQWVSNQTSLLAPAGLDLYSDRWPKSGSMRNGAVYERPMLEPHISGTAGSPSLMTPTAAEGVKPSNTMGVERRRKTGQVFLTNQIVTLLGLDPSEG